MLNGCKVCIENKDGTFCVEGSKQRYTVEELEKIQALMPGYGWIFICRPKPHEITNPSYVPYNDDED